jgi:phage protein D
MTLGVAIRLDGAPDDTVSGAVSVEVTERIGHPTYYRLEYAFDIEESDFPILKDRKLGPGSELSIFVPAGGTTHCLVKGPVYGQQIRFDQSGGGSTLTVLGADTSIKLDREDKVAAWSDLTDSDAASSILSQAGYVPDVESTPAGHLETKHTLIQRETDLAFLRRLARRNGSFFWISCDEAGVETAHFKRPPLGGQAALDLVMHLTDPRPNVTTLEISWDVERPTSTSAAEVDLSDKSVISGDAASSPLTPLGGTALGDVVTDARVVHVRAPVDDNGDLQARSEGALIEASFFVKTSGATTLGNLGNVLRAHTLVNLRGVGSRHSGLWFCSAVRHSIDAAEHRMDFDLIRNGWTD